ncbi:hypothetical protein F0562_027582 [Nyssa sinensis]|uniref:Uncharacterized protein n=1 Tax=Nyssa sinensis TaxID=561372 RepID=A0A5J5B5B9_9ASTE|nr:hypothetical protein F0562_027582 [Nyssa sinensis]
MGFGFLRNLTKHSTLLISQRRSVVNSGVWVESSFLPNQQQCRADAHQLSKIRVSVTSRPFYISSSRCNSYSSLSSSSSYSKMGFLGWYLGMLESRPVLTKSVTASLIFAAADLTSQMITLPFPGSFDSIRTLRMALYGMLILGPAQHLWFNFVSRVLPKRDIVTTLKKLIMGQVIYGPVINTIFFTFSATLQGTLLCLKNRKEGESGSEVVARLKRDLLPTLVNGLLYWPVCDFLTYKIIPVHLQPLINSSFSYLWTIYLTYMASLKKAAAD